MSRIAFYEFFSILILLFKAMFVRKKEGGYSKCQDYSFLCWEREGLCGSFRGTRKSHFLTCIVVILMFASYMC